MAQLDHSMHLRFGRALEELCVRGPVAGPRLDVQPLSGRDNVWRLRVGSYRAIFEVQGDAIRVTRIAHRSVAYRL